MKKAERYNKLVTDDMKRIRDKFTSERLMKFKLETIVDIPFDNPKVISIELGFADGCKTIRRVPISHLKRLKTPQKDGSR